MSLTRAISEDHGPVKGWRQREISEVKWTSAGEGEENEEGSVQQDPRVSGHQKGFDGSRKCCKRVGFARVRSGVLGDVLTQQTYFGFGTVIRALLILIRLYLQLGFKTATA